jgi:hypothetical protein
MKRLLALVVVLVGCKKPSPAHDKPSPAPDAKPADGDPDENDVRAGKRTGLATPDEKPEVATEALARALVRGKVPWSKVVDSSVGLVEMRSLPASDTAAAETTVEHRCGAALDTALANFNASAVSVLDAPGLIYDVQCDNVGLAVTIAGVTSHAVCSIASPSEEGTELDMVFVPDPNLGLRLIGISTADATTTEDELRDRFDEELGRFGRHCP